MSILLEQNSEYDIRINSRGTKFYYKKGTKTVHRINGPAIEWDDGSIEYVVNGETHRLDGPAIIDADGFIAWCINGVRLSPEKEAILNKWWDNKKETNNDNNKSKDW